MNEKQEKKWEYLIMRKLYDLPGREAVLLPHMFNPPILLTNIQRIGMTLNKKGFSTAPDRRLGGWHLRLLEPGIAACQAAPAQTP